MQATGAKISSQNGNSADLVIQPGCWSLTSNPGANAQATVTKAAVTGVRHICTGIFVSLTQDATGGSPWQGLVNLIDGASGGSAYLLQEILGVITTAGAQGGQINLTGLSFVGSVATAMTLEFSGAGPTHSVQSVTLAGYDII